MIFLTVGTTRFSFDRLLGAVDRAMVELQTKEKLIIQKGESNYQFKYPRVEIFEEIPFDKMIFYFKKARVVIGHGGLATIFLVLNYAQSKPFVVPRSKRFGEHTDDHQIFFAEFLKKGGRVEVVFPQEDIFLRIKNYLKKPKKITQKKKIFPSKKLIKKLINYCNEK